jgi:hypothetical protein
MPPTGQHPTPEEQIDQYVRGDIERHGWHVAKIEGDEKVPPWAFTIGFGDTFGHPEVLVAGMALHQLHALLNRIGDLLRAGNRFEAGQDVHNILEGFACAFRPVHPHWHQPFAGNAAWHHRDAGLELLQCFWPDPEGRFPWDEGFPVDLTPLQPLLYEPDPDRALAPSVRATLEEEGVL